MIHMLNLCGGLCSHSTDARLNQEIIKLVPFHDVHGIVAGSPFSQCGSARICKLNLDLSVKSTTPLIQDPMSMFLTPLERALLGEWDTNCWTWNGAAINSDAS